MLITGRCIGLLLFKMHIAFNLRPIVTSEIVESMFGHALVAIAPRHILVGSH